MATQSPTLSSPASEDANPDVELPVKNNKMFRFDPATPVTFLSMIMNFGIANVCLYGATGLGRTSYLLSLLTIPPTLVFCIRDAQRDFENWEKTRKFREKNFPAHVLPYKVRYDWSNYEDVLFATRERRLEAERLENERIADKERSL